MKKALVVLAGLLSFSACSSSPARPEGAAVIIKQGHFHTRYCGHYRFGDTWYFIEKHRHGVDCDHEQVDGEWILPTD